MKLTIHTSTIWKVLQFIGIALMILTLLYIITPKITTGIDLEEPRISDWHISDSLEDNSKDINCSYILEKSKEIEPTPREIEIIQDKCP